MKKIVSCVVVGLMMTAAVLPARAAANAEQAKPASELNEFTSVVAGIVEGFEALTKAADAEPSAQPAAKNDEAAKPAVADQANGEAAKQRSLKNSAILIAGGAGLGASVGKMTGRKNAAMIGAIAGGVAGLIYDRATYKNPKGI